MYRCVAALVRTHCKSHETDSRHLRQCLGGVFVNEGNIIFRGVIQGQEIIEYLPHQKHK